MKKHNNSLLIVAGSGQYPALVIEGARAAGVEHIAVLAIRGQTRRSVVAAADETITLGVGEMQRGLDWLTSRNIANIMLAGQIRPSALFTTRFDKLGRQLLASLRVKNAHSIFGLLASELESHKLRVLPASTYMEAHLPAAGLLTERAPDERERSDIAHGIQAVHAIGNVDIGQTVVVKEGMVLAVEAFEGTDAAIRRGARLGGRGIVVVKAARIGHDMRFDIPVVGAVTMRVLRRARATALALPAHRIILLDREAVIATANRLKLAITVEPTDLPPAPTRPPAPEQPA